MAKAVRAAAVGILLAAGCAATRPGGGRPFQDVRPPAEAEPDCVARTVNAHAPVGDHPVSARATFEFWLEADGSPGPVERVSWVEGLDVEGELELTNEVARAIARCAWIPRSVGGRPVRALVVVPIRFAASSEAEPERASAPATREEIRPAREAVPGCVSRTLPLPAGVTAGVISSALFLVRVEADGSKGAVTMMSAVVGLDDLQRRALADEVVAALGKCSFAPGTVNGEPARTFWIAEVRFAGPGSGRAIVPAP